MQNHGSHESYDEACPECLDEIAAGGATERKTLAEIRATAYGQRTFAESARLGLYSGSLDDAERMYKQGRVTEDDLAEFLKVWNAGPHFTQAVFSDGAIRNFDPETRKFPPAVEERFGVRR